MLQAAADQQTLLLGAAVLQIGAAAEQPNAAEKSANDSTCMQAAGCY